MDNSLIAAYAAKIIEKHTTSRATEHSYRSALESLLEGIENGLRVLNEPRRVACGAPDFSISQNGVEIGHCEAKDITVDISRLTGANAEQQERYRRGLPNLLYTNGLDFEFFRLSSLVRRISIGRLTDQGIKLDASSFEPLANQLRAFVQERPPTIVSVEALVEQMAGRAVLIKDIMTQALRMDRNQNTELNAQYEAFKKHLLHEITESEFADLYAETIAYGLFAARLHDTTPDSFTRAEALELLPKSNPFLRSLFGYIAGVDLDDRIRWVIDELAEVFRACDLASLLKSFGKSSGRSDPFLHFYEDFLSAYNPTKRKARGVWYTPEPVVKFIVRAVDHILQTDFSLPLGLSDTSRVVVDWDTGQKAKIKKSVHRVQFLDPATGTGTFLAEIVRSVGATVTQTAPGAWSQYVEKDLIPRLNGFELLMASYAMCHMKLDMLLTELGYTPSQMPPRLNVYLTNSLEEGDEVVQSLFAQWLANEAKHASEIKKQMPIMCVVGNPPYSGISQNMGGWIVDLIDEYKYVDGKHFGERKHWLHDDYVKFIRFAEHMIDRNGEGILAYITNNGYLDNPTFRGMRHHLRRTFDRLYVLDLHGNSKKKEVSPDGTPDKNVFDIQQGVAILLAVKRKSATSQKRARKQRAADSADADVLHAEVWGSREQKYEFLGEQSLATIRWSELQPYAPYYMFTPASRASREEYDAGFSLNALFQVHCTGIITARDDLVIDFDEDALEEKVRLFADVSQTDEAVRAKFFSDRKVGKYLAGDSRGWNLASARRKLAGRNLRADMVPITYRPFDDRQLLYSEDMVDWGRQEVMAHITRGENVALLSPRMTADTYSPFVSKHVISNKSGSRYDQTYFFPLYLYASDDDLDSKRRVNFAPALAREICKAAGISSDGTEQVVFDYVYGVLSSPNYAEKFADYLKLDFPRVPFPSSTDSFRRIASIGGELRQLHLSRVRVNESQFMFHGVGSNRVDKVQRTDEGRLHINATQYFSGVGEDVWRMEIGGYQPAQKWLKDRTGRVLRFQDIRRYQVILATLLRTGELRMELAAIQI